MPVCWLKLGYDHDHTRNEGACSDQSLTPNFIVRLYCISNDVSVVHVISDRSHRLLALDP